MIPFNLHYAQSQPFLDNKRMRVVVAGRRFGKTRLLQWELIRASLSFPGTIDPQSPQMVLGVLPTLKQAKGLLWTPLVNMFETVLKPYCKKIDRTDHIIYPTDGKPPILIAGANDNDGDGLRGKRIWYIGCDEYQDWKPEIFNLIVRPAMADTPGSRSLFTGTPKGKLNHYFRVYNRTMAYPKVWSSYHFKTSDNITIVDLEAELAQAKLELPPRQYRQEYEASFEDFEGKVFSELDEGNLTAILPLGGTCWLGIDWGDVNPAISVWKRTPGLEYDKPVWTFMEGWQGNFSLTSQGGTPITTPVFQRELVRLARKYQVAGAWCDPSRPASILETRALGAREGLRGLMEAVEGYNGIQEGLDYMHSLVYQKRLKIFTGQKKDNPWVVDGTEFYELMSSYHRAKNKDGVVVEKIEDGQNDHTIDASRYCLVPSPKGHYASST